jgi:hypothetical protein
MPTINSNDDDIDVVGRLLFVGYRRNIWDPPKNWSLQQSRRHQTLNFSASVGARSTFFKVPPDDCHVFEASSGPCSLLTVHIYIYT